MLELIYKFVTSHGSPSVRSLISSHIVLELTTEQTTLCCFHVARCLFVCCHVLLCFELLWYYKCYFITAIARTGSFPVLWGRDSGGLEGLEVQSSLLRCGMCQTRAVQSACFEGRQRYLAGSGLSRGASPISLWWIADVLGKWRPVAPPW